MAPTERRRSKLATKEQEPKPSVLCLDPFGVQTIGLAPIKQLTHSLVVEDATLRTHIDVATLQTLFEGIEPSASIRSSTSSPSARRAID